MDDDKARQLLAAEREEVEGLLRQLTSEDREVAQGDDEPGDSVDRAQPLEVEGRDDALEADLREKLEAIARAEERLAQGTYGRSVLSGDPIPDARLEAQPAAELTVEEAEKQAQRRS